MKKKIFLLFFVLMLLSGCVKSTTTMKISPTKSINFESDFLISTELDNGTSLDKIDQKKLASDVGSNRKNDWKSVENSKKASENAEKPSIFLRIHSGFPVFRLNTCKPMDYNLLETKGL